MKDRLDWAVDGSDWPNRSASRFVPAAGITWHVQVMGSGPVVLLLHGTGASTHSWAGLAPLLAEHFCVVAVDLPGHAFTQTPRGGGLTLPGMARGVAELMATLGVAPRAAIGHSAGAAILKRMCLDGTIAPQILVSLNGAFFPFGGFAATIFSPLAKLLALNPFVPRLFAWRAEKPDAVRSLLVGTGSAVDDAMLARYGLLFQCVAHVDGTLGMMANWDLNPLQLEMTRLRVPLLLVAGTRDAAVPPGDAERVRRRIPSAEVIRLEGLGHLAHEEQPAAVWQALQPRLMQVAQPVDTAPI